jgi:hypothetical protein
MASKDPIYSPHTYRPRFTYFDVDTGDTRWVSPAQYSKWLRRFIYLNKMISKYKHLWPGNARLERWVDEYNTYTYQAIRTPENKIKQIVMEDFGKFHGWAERTTAYDILA